MISTDDRPIYRPRRPPSSTSHLLNVTDVRAGPDTRRDRPESKMRPWTRTRVPKPLSAHCQRQFSRHLRKQNVSSRGYVIGRVTCLFRENEIMAILGHDRRRDNEESSPRVTDLLSKPGKLIDWNSSRSPRGELVMRLGNCFFPQGRSRLAKGGLGSRASTTGDNESTSEVRKDVTSHLLFSWGLRLRETKTPRTNSPHLRKRTLLIKLHQVFTANMSFS